MMISPDWIALDWGTTNLRAWAMSSDGEIIASAESDAGMATLTPNEFEPTLINLIEPWLSENRTIPVNGCGMVGAKQGWQEIPYATAPCAPKTAATPIATRDRRVAVNIHAGVKQNPPADVMRGEETQIAGFLALQPGFEGVICLPGTHSKWVKIENGLIHHFQTFMTGEIFQLLAEKSVLRHSVDSAEFDEPAFLNAFQNNLDHPEKLSGALFSLRAESLLVELSPGVARSRMSGTLIGIEFAGARQFWKNETEIAIIGNEKLSANYKRALHVLNVKTQLLRADEAALAGLRTLC